MEFQSQPSPHVRPRESVPHLMRRVLYALLPAALAHTWFFGAGLWINLLFAACACLATEACVLKLRGRRWRPALQDGSALVTAALLAFALPPLAPWWLPAIAAASAMLLGKHLYGGLGRNLFNPAMVGYVIVLLSFPVEMTRWIPPYMGDLDYDHLGWIETLRYSLAGTLPAELSIDALTRATPLDLIKEGLSSMRTFREIRGGPLFGDFGGRGWEWINNCVALGGLYLLYVGVIRWQIPSTTLLGLLIPATLFHLIDASRYPSPGFHLFSGAALLGAFFIATDPVSAATSERGRLIYGAGIGLLTYAIRTWGGYPDGVAFAVLLMNASVPLIDRYTRPRTYGHV
jgi:electron transport complex protein RnfD